MKKLLLLFFLCSACVFATDYYAKSTGNLTTISYATSHDGVDTVAWGSITASDTIYADNRTVTINTPTVNLVKLTTETYGGQFNVTSDATITADIVAGTSICLQVSGTPTVVVNGDVLGGTATNDRGIYIVGMTAVTVNGTVTGGSTSDAIGVYCQAAGTLTLNGDIAADDAIGVYLSGTTSTVNITGDVSGGVGANALGVQANGASVVLTVDGDVSGGSGSGAGGIQLTSATSLAVSGSVTSGDAVNSYGIETAGSIPITVESIVFDPTLAGAPFNVTDSIYFDFGEIVYYSESGGVQKTFTGGSDGGRYGGGGRYN